MQMTSFVFRETLMTHLLLWGNSAVFPSALTAAMGSSAGNVQPSFTNFETTTSRVRSNSNTLFFLQETGIPCLPMPLDFFWTIIKLRDRLSRATPPVGDLSRIGDIAKRYPLSRAAPYKIKKQRSHHFVQAQMGGITVF